MFSISNFLFTKTKEKKRKSRDVTIKLPSYKFL